MKLLVRPLSQKRSFRKRFDSQHLKPSPILAKSLWERFYCLFHYFEEIWFGKCHPYCHVKSSGCFLTQWVPMATNLFNIAKIFKSQFKRNYLKNEKLFLNFLFHFWNLHQILNILKKKMMVIANVFSKLQTVKNFFTPLCKKCHFGTRLDSRRLKVSALLSIFFHHFGESWFGKHLL